MCMDAHWLVLRVCDPLKSLATVPSLLVNCYRKQVSQKFQAAPPPPPPPCPPPPPPPPPPRPPLNTQLQTRN